MFDWKPPQDRLACRLVDSTNHSSNTLTIVSFKVVSIVDVRTIGPRSIWPARGAPCQTEGESAALVAQGGKPIQPLLLRHQHIPATLHQQTPSQTSTNAIEHPDFELDDRFFATSSV
jgi:hypothetical protein